MKDNDAVERITSGDYDPEKITRQDVMEYIFSKQQDPNTYVVWESGNHIIN